MQTHKLIQPVYNPVVDKKQLILGTGNEIIITGWTPKDKVYNKLQSKNLNFAAIGNLYSPTLGLEGIFINLLSNPYNWTISTLEEQRQDLITPGVNALHQFFKGNYFLSNNRYLITNDSHDIVGSFDATIFKHDDLKWLISTYKEAYRYYRFVDLLEGLEGRSKDTRELVKLREPVLVEIKRLEAKSIPARSVGHQVIAATIDEAYTEALYLVLNHGKEDNKEGVIRREIIGLTSCVESSALDRDLKESASGISEYIDTVINSQQRDDLSVSYVYGDRIRNYSGVDQVEGICNLLIENELSTRLYIDLWQVDKDLGSDNPPCLTSVWVKLVNKRLILTAQFRSHDIYSAYKQNLIALKSLQELIVNKVNERSGLGVEAGAIVINSLSAHIYSNCYDLAYKELDKRSKNSPAYNDPVGNFIIKWEQNIGPIVVDQMEPNGGIVKTYLGKTSSKVIDNIIHTNPSIDRHHLAYLVQELIRAELKTTSYAQDVV